MDKIEVFISGEDPVTVAVIKRVLNHVSDRFKIINNIPARGGEIKSKVPQCNILALKYPVIMLLDLDNGCAPDLKKKLLSGHKQNPHFIFNICVDEAEAWLMADREGFSNYFDIEINKIPDSKMQRQGGNTLRMEMNFNMKSSLVFTHQLALQSNKDEIRKRIGVSDITGPKKGKEYNDAVVPFVENNWDIQNALTRSDSLQRMVKRLTSLLTDY